MKLTKYILFACTALFMVSCGDSDEWNTDSNVTVQMAQAKINTRENKKYFNVPLEVLGQTNGPIRVTVDVTEISDNPAVENVNYIITSNTVVIPNNDSEVSIEITPVNDRVINEDRVFIVSIVNAEGAKIGEQNSTEITLRDDDSIPYEAIQGTWTFKYTSGFQGGGTGSFEATIYGIEDDNDPLYNHVLYMSGWDGSEDLVSEVAFSVVKETNEVALRFDFGQKLGKLKLNVGDCDIKLLGCDGYYLYEQGSWTAMADPTYTNITFSPNEGFYLEASLEGEVLGGILLPLSITMTRE